MGLLQRVGQAAGTLSHRASSARIGVCVLTTVAKVYASKERLDV